MTDEEQYTNADINERWEEFVRQSSENNPILYLTQLNDLQLRYPEVRSFSVKFADLNSFDPDFAMYLLEYPERVIKVGESVLAQRQSPSDTRTEYCPLLRIYGLPKDVTIGIRYLRHENIGNLVAIEGLVRRASEVRPKIIVAHFECARCGITIKQEQGDEDILIEPMQCDPGQSGCSRTSKDTRFKLLRKRSEYKDTQILEIQEIPEGLRGGSQPERISCVLADDLTDNDKRVSPGDRATFNGVIDTSPIGKHSNLSGMLLRCNSVEFSKHEYDQIEIDEEDEKQIIEASRSKDIVLEISKNVAPSVWGYEREKESVTLQLFGGQHKQRQDGTRVRGDIHILIPGDPGVAKTLFLTCMKELAPRAIFATGGASSGVGLTAAAVKDDATGGRWSLEAGALVLADRGLCCIDELDKMEISDAGAIHEAMEQQTVTVTKAGINATLQARCAILAALNPKYGRFDISEPLAQQVDLTPALLSRFDLIFALRDVPDEENDRHISEYIRKNRTCDTEKPKFSNDFIRKYVAYARNKIQNQTYSDSAGKIVDDYYTTLRKKSKETGSIAITPRQVEGIYRLAEASARARLSQLVEERDVRRAIAIVEYYLRKLAMDGDNMDIDKLMTGIPKSQKDRFKVMESLIDTENDGQGMTKDELYIAFEPWGVHEIDNTIERLREGRVIYEYKGMYRTVSGKTH